MTTTTTDEGLSPTETPDLTDTVTTDVVPEVTPESDDSPETFPREYVEDLRKENGKYRQRAQQADDLAARLHLEMVKATGRLADPTDLPFEEDHVRDAPRLVEAIDALLAAKPHLASRKPTGDIGQGATVAPDSFSLAGLLRGSAG
ncbi:MAG: hypothetical protein ACOH19_15010 [Rhodoglobus sp.]